MELFDNLALGLATAATWQNLLFCFAGVMIGTLVGVLPGISPLTTVAMLLPFTFGLAPASALIMLAGIFYGAQYGSSTAAILVNVPGETSSIVTCIDGYQMAKQGRAGSALAIAAIASFFAGTVATIVIALLSLPLAAFALKFTAVETVSLIILGLLGAVVLAHGSPPKAIAMIVVGVLLGLVGVDVNSGVPRMTFGIADINDGIGFVPIAIGLFGIAEMIHNLERPQDAQFRRHANFQPGADARRPQARLAGHGTRDRGRLHSRRAAGRRRGAAAVLGLCAGKEDCRRSLAFRQGRHRGRRIAGSRQQCRRADELRADAHARHPLDPLMALMIGAL